MVLPSFAAFLLLVSPKLTVLWSPPWTLRHLKQCLRKSSVSVMLPTKAWGLALPSGYRVRQGKTQLWAREYMVAMALKLARG
jgi:hypothetical protein